ncbi:NUDIX domain-containing protein [Pseudosporangium ferrugineum]|uniref:NUDIX domain-containing protein n=1 Tax=Pseudosporangium ferrugineum TaxID=439699 RepID=UPI002481E834|nr:NUDIX hydrolase [Pseudosporangium ferrugineum]
MTSKTPPMATPRIAAGALFFDDDGRILLVKPSYKDGWEIPGGYVEPGESPRAACIREIEEEIGLSVAVGSHLVVDWAPIDAEGDKILFIFDAGVPTERDRAAIRFRDGELTEWKFVHPSDLDGLMPLRLIRRIHTAIDARNRGVPVYAEYGSAPHESEQRYKLETT